MDVQKGSDAKDTYGPLSSVNPPISVAEHQNHFHPTWTQDLFCQPEHPPLYH